MHPDIEGIALDRRGKVSEDHMNSQLLGQSEGMDIVERLSLGNFRQRSQLFCDLFCVIHAFAVLRPDDPEDLGVLAVPENIQVLL